MSPLDTIRVSLSKEKPESKSDDFAEQDWRHLSHKEGQLAVDVFETEDDLYVVSALAGVKTATLEVSLHNELLTIRGVRQSPFREGEASAIYLECFWGPFSRTIVLPVDVRADKAKATYKYGVLTLKMPKRNIHGTIPVEIVDE